MMKQIPPRSTSLTYDLMNYGRQSPTPSPSFTKKIKHFYLDENKEQITAGGVLFYNSEGIWVISEKCRKKGEDTIEYTDIGGRYHYDDIDIYQTISRELNEETYFSIEYKRSELIEIIQKNKNAFIYVNGGKFNKPTYKCYLIHTSTINKDISIENFNIGKEYANKINNKYYKIDGLHFILWDRINEKYLSHRLKWILRNMK